ncbi:MAG: RpiB/LacA/LacB family sugar-phosphate isomerase [Patescibacteria group bacterium]
MKPTIVLGGDHAGFDLKEQIEAALLEDGYTVHDLGNTEFDAGDDYPKFAKAVANAVAGDQSSRGILFCGNAEGVCIVANKVDDVRAGIGFSTEAVRTARNDDDINVLCLPGRMMAFDTAREIVRVFLETPFEGAQRQQRRLGQIADIEENN